MALFLLVETEGMGKNNKRGGGGMEQSVGDVVG